MDRALKHGLGGIVQADPFENNQAADTFSCLQRLTLLHRLNDSYTCLVCLDSPSHANNIQVSTVINSLKDPHAVKAWFTVN